MKNIIRTFVAFWLLAFVALCCSSCRTLPSGNVAVAGYEVTPSQVQRNLALATRFGVREAIRSDPNAKAYFVAALAVLDASLNTGTYDPQLVRGALFGISVRELQEVRVVDAVQVVLELYNANVSEIISKKLDAHLYLRAALLGLRDGVAQGLGQ